MPARTMLSSRSRVVTLLNAISRPAAPFFETKVQYAIRTICRSHLEHPGFQLIEDRYGNLIASFHNAAKPAMPCLALIAHMDHPGFDLLEIDGNRIKAAVMGGLPRGDDLLNTKVLIIDGDTVHQGCIREYADTEQKLVWMDLDRPPGGLRRHMFAVPDLERFKVDPPFIRGRAMDDLAGCAIALAVLEIVIRKNIPIDLMAVFHRAEEVGLIGAQAVCQSRAVPPHALVVCLEASKALENAQPGNGIVIRTGDRICEFDRNAERLLDSAAEQLDRKGVKTQKHRMTGGTCEASIYLAHGYETTALAVPLLNYHNHGEGKLEPEIIHVYDLNSGVELLHKAAVLLPAMNYLQRFYLKEDRKKRFDEVKHRLTGISKGP
ncbi:M20/M25/M40 family metallo-hydrolase [bacterium]|nr:M20/M25/M40 family metallo-hydrolase [candidate division CSSED10-310 bacterium]